MKGARSKRARRPRRKRKMVLVIARSCCARSRTHSMAAAVKWRHLSFGALGGGYSKENLAYFAASHFAKGRKRRRIEDEVDEDELPYADMFNQQISPDANEWLKSHPSPSVVLARSFFASAAFAPERTILSLATSGPGKALPDISFNVGESHLLWTVAAKSPLEIILTWELETLGLAKGATQLAFDPSLRRVYQGNALNQVPAWASALIPLHERYAKYLLQGMVDEIESATVKSGVSNYE